jgi:transcriptional regulator with XRE-family HTH domain
VAFVRSRRIPDKKIEQARELRGRGLSLREIARRLHISKSSTDRFGRGISPEQSEELQEDLDQPTGETLPEQDVSQNVSGQDKSLLELLFEQRYYVSECAKSTAKLGDKAGEEMDA